MKLGELKIKCKKKNQAQKYDGLYTKLMFKEEKITILRYII